jgi:hypothetical protein
MRALVTAAAIVAVLSASAPASAQARAEQACWRAVLTDWSNGGIDRRHSLGCYRSALHNLPNDLRTYTTAEDDIRRAILDEIRNVRGTARAATAATAAGAKSSTGTTKTTTPEPARALQGRGGTPDGVPAATTTADTAPPLRAVAAAGVALLLVLAAGIGKYHARRRGTRTGSAAS